MKYNLNQTMIAKKVEDGYLLISELDDETYYKTETILDTELAPEGDPDLVAVFDYGMTTEKCVPVAKKYLKELRHPLMQIIPDLEAKLPVYKVLKHLDERYFLNAWATDLRDASMQRTLIVNVTDKNTIQVINTENSSDERLS